MWEGPSLLTTGDITVLNGYDGVFHIIAFQIVNDDLAIGTKLGCKAVGQTGVNINGTFIHVLPFLTMNSLVI